MPVAGIDLGTTNSCIAVWQNKKVVVIKNGYKETTTPSCVAFTDGGFVVGNTAIAQQSTNPENTIFEVKRLIGQTHAEMLRKENKNWPFAITKEENGRIKYMVKICDEEKYFYPEEISGIVLKNLKEYAEDFIKQEVIQNQNQNKTIHNFKKFQSNISQC